VAQTIDDLVWTFRNIKVAPSLGDRTNVVTAIDYTITLNDGPHSVRRFGNAALSTADITPFVLLEDATESDLAAMAIQMYGPNVFDHVFAGMQDELEAVKALGTLDPALSAKLPFGITLATPADIAISATVPPEWREDSTPAIGQVYRHQGELWKNISGNNSEPGLGRSEDWELFNSEGGDPRSLQVETAAQAKV
jgi:hypothetical protein